MPPGCARSCRDGRTGALKRRSGRTASYSTNISRRGSAASSRTSSTRKGPIFTTEDARSRGCSSKEKVKLSRWRRDARGRETGRDMNQRVSAMKPEKRVGRRDFLRTLGAGAGVAGTASAPLAQVAAADSESNEEKRKARYQANSPDVQDFYRVNRYPAKSN